MKTPGPWEVYDVVKDRGETQDLAKERPGLIAHAVEVLKKETTANANFPLELSKTGAVGCAAKHCARKAGSVVSAHE